MSLINFDNLPNGMVSGLSCDELIFISNESAERFELDRHLFDDLEKELSGDNYVVIDDEILRDIDKAEITMTPNNTKNKRK